MLVVLVLLLNALAHSFPLELLIRRPTLNSMTATFTMPFTVPFTKPPYFGYGIEGVYLQTTQSAVSYSILSSELTTYTVELTLQTVINSINGNEFIDMVFIWVYCPYIEIGMAELGTLNQLVSYKQGHYWNFQTSYSLSVSTATFPLLWNVTSKSTLGFTIQLTQTPTIISFKRIIMYILVEKIFISQRIYALFNVISQTRRYFIIRLINSNALAASDQNSFQVITQVAFTGPSVSLPKIIKYQFYDSAHKPCIKIGFLSSNTVLTKLTAIFISFNPKYASCPQYQFLSYLVPYTTLPRKCLPCDPSCLTCTSAQQDSAWTDYRYCTTCADQKYIEPIPNMKCGLCKCLKGLQVDPQGNCLPCQFNCLQFRVQFMQSAKSPTFFIIFTMGTLKFVSNFSDNLAVYVDDVLIPYQYGNRSLGTFNLSLDINNLTNCTTSCQLKFKFQRPENVQYQSTQFQRYLTKQTRNLTLKNFFIASRDLPPEFTAAMQTVTYIVAASTSSGQASLLKMLFELEQSIEAHKYLNFQIPVVFKDFIQNLNNFRFMDITAIIPSLGEFMKSLGVDDMACKGHYKVVYYESGANFYKNIVAIIISFFAIALLNVVVVLILYIIPCQITRDLGRRLKDRWYVTLSQLLQSLILPTALFFTFQIHYTLPNSNYLWIYILAYTFCFLVLVYPLFILTFTSKQRSEMKADELDRLEDLLQDCKLTSNYTYFLYLYGYWKKFFTGVILAAYFPGYVQNSILLVFNCGHIFIIMAIATKNLYKSVWKMIFRTGTLICIIAIQMLISLYNLNSDWDKDQKTKVGTACFYISITATALGLAQFIAKILQFVFHKISHRFDCFKRCVKKKQSHSNYVKSKDNAKLKHTTNKNPIVFNVSEGSQEGENNQNKQKEQQYQDVLSTSSSRKLRGKKKQKGKSRNQGDEKDQSEEWSRFQQQDKNKQTIQVVSQSSEIVMIGEQIPEQKGYYKRQNKAKIPADSNTRFPTASTKVGQTKKQTISNKVDKNNNKGPRNKEKIKKTIDNSGYRRNRIQRVNDKKWKTYDQENQSSMSQIVEIP